MSDVFVPGQVERVCEPAWVQRATNVICKSGGGCRLLSRGPPQPMRSSELASVMVDGEQVSVISNEWASWLNSERPSMSNGGRAYLRNMGLERLECNGKFQYDEVGGGTS